MMMNDEDMDRFFTYNSATVWFMFMRPLTELVRCDSLDSAEGQKYKKTRCKKQTHFIMTLILYFSKCHSI